MNKKIYIAFLYISLAFILTGCGNKIPEMTEAQQQQVCEYAAQILMSHNKFYTSRVVDEETIVKEKEKLESAAVVRTQVEAEKEAKKKAKEQEEEEKKKNKDDNSDSSSQLLYADIDEFLNLSGIDIEYAGYQICDSYPSETTENDWQGVCRASGGNKLVVFKFDIQNLTDSDYYLDMASMSTRFTFKINGKMSKSALTTLLSDDLIMYRDNIPANEKKQAVIIVELSGNDADNIESVVMKFKYEGNVTEKTLL